MLASSGAGLLDPEPIYFPLLHFKCYVCVSMCGCVD